MSSLGESNFGERSPVLKKRQVPNNPEAELSDIHFNSTEAKKSKNPFLDSRAESMSTFKSIGTIQDEDYRRKKIVQTLQNLSICPEILKEKSVNWL